MADNSSKSETVIEIDTAFELALIKNKDSFDKYKGDIDFLKLAFIFGYQVGYRKGSKNFVDYLEGFSNILKKW